MNQKFWSSLTIALLIAIVGPNAASLAASSPSVKQDNQANVPPTQNPDNSETSTVSSKPSGPEAKAITVAQSPSQTGVQSEPIAKIYAHVVAGRQAATVYVRNIPIVTFLGAGIGSPRYAPLTKGDIKPGKNTETATRQASNSLQASKSGQNNPYLAGNAVNFNDNDDPVARATALAAQINQLQDSIDANSISVSPKTGDTYEITINNQVLVAINSETILPDTTLNRALDALQATNRLRRLLGNAPPLAQIPGLELATMPARDQAPAYPRTPENSQISLGPVMYRLTGWASWYGPGFDGNASASGEIFNENDLTAAHRDLPFGTMVRVTNLDNGSSVVVRINDRGPYVGDRIIDLSAGAAQVLGMLNSGVAPVSLEVLGSQNASQNQ